MDPYISEFKKILRAHSQSVTKPRREVFFALFTHGIQTMSELRSHCSTIDRASVYRTVSLFESIGIIVRVPQGFRYKIELSDAFIPHHHHITCTKCGAQKDIEQLQLENLLQTIASANQYNLTSHKVELSGICGKCKLN